MTTRSYITSQTPGVGGVIKVRPTDFLVDEVPLYQPTGSGEHIYMLVQKVSMSTFDAIQVLADHFKVDRNSIGYAGLKDKHALTRQVFSIHTPGKTPEDFPSLEHPQLGVMWVDLHQNKLKRGHLAGNRFSIRIREVSPAAVIHAGAALKTLGTRGVPNRFGPQRFGLLGNNHIVAARILTGDYAGACDALLGPNADHPTINTQARAAYAAGDYATSFSQFPFAARAERSVLRRLMNRAIPKNAILGMDPEALEFYFSSFQSAIFNDVLDQRIESGGFAQLIEGDLAMKAENRATFPIDAELAQDPDTFDRLTRGEISTTGPMWGPEMRRASGAVDAIEVAALEKYGLTPDAIVALPKAQARLMSGERRALRTSLRDPDVEGGVDEHGPYIRCVFELPRGGFATTVMDEVMKVQHAPEGEEANEGT
jgi:tRNA pseudouridine13 synthase